MEALEVSAPDGLSGRSVLVTGAYGLLGSWLVEALLDGGARVVAIRRDEPAVSPLELLGLQARVDVVPGDIRDEGVVARALNEYDVDSVFHLAAQTLVGTANRDPLSTFETNVRGTWLVLEACRRHGAERVVVASSDKAYGPHVELPYEERQPLAARHPYDVSKASADMIARSYWHTYGLPVAVTRFANLYGGGGHEPLAADPGGGVCGARSAARRCFAPTGRRSATSCTWRMRSARTLAIWELLGRGAGAGEAFNAGGGAPHRVGDVVELICRLAGTDVAPDIRGAGTPPGRSTASGSIRESSAS